MELLKQWDIEGSAITLLQEKVWSIDSSYILKAYENEEECLKIIYLYQEFKRSGIPIPEVIPTKSGDNYATQDAAYHILTRRLNGNHLLKEEIISNPLLAHHIGTVIAKLHQAFAEITGQIKLLDNDFMKELTGWITESIQKHAAGSFTHTILQDCVSELGSVYDKLERHLIHRDLHLGNLLFEGNEVTGYIDFDLSQINVRIFDIAYLCAGWAVDQVQDSLFMAGWKQALQSIIAGYQEEQPLSVLERNAMGVMMCSIELLFVAYFRSINDTVNSSKSEECLKWLWENRKNMIE